MLVNVARAQQEEMGDGTTTATLLAAALVEEGAKQVFRGVPVAKVIAGIGKGVRFALQKMQEIARPIWELDDEWLQRIAFTAGRENEDISELVIEAAQMVGREKLMEKNFKLCDCVVAHPRAESEVFAGILINRGRMNLQMPAYKHDVRVLVVGDALEPEPVDEEALSTEAGFARQMELKDEFLQIMEKLIQMDIGLIVVDRGVDPVAEEMLADAGVMVVQRVPQRDLSQVADHTGARIVKRSALRKLPEELEAVIGHCEEVEDHEPYQRIRVSGVAENPLPPFWSVLPPRKWWVNGSGSARMPLPP